MPEGMVDMLTKEEIGDLLAFVRAVGYNVPNGLKHGNH